MPVRSDMNMGDDPEINDERVEKAVIFLRKIRKTEFFGGRAVIAPTIPM